MGLDQYLEARQYVSKSDWTGGVPVTTADFTTLEPMTQTGVIDPNSFSGITLEYNAAQWRKANAIHRWMEDNLTVDGLENCQSYSINSEKLKELREACNRVLAAKSDKTAQVAEENGLTPMQGFFFGSYDFDEWYFRDLEYTVETINRLDQAGALNPESDVTFTYRAWW
ncbi:MAG: hypothetical protein EB168_05440 [Euryarchaeota archaeon]|nr:hypothetical protein [Euryarchaeota archaeon]